MISDAVEVATTAIAKSARWFSQILDSVGAGEFYIAMVFIVMACGFLLSNFATIRVAGSDLADAAAKAGYRGKYDRNNPVRRRGVATHGKYEKRGNRRSGHAATPKNYRR